MGSEGAGSEAELAVYLLDDSAKFRFRIRPAVIVCPGGGYGGVSDREGEIVAMQFLAMGYHAAVLKYSVAPARYPTALTELGRAVLLLREHAGEWNISGNKIAIAGFSAGGHLAASYCMFWKEQWLSDALGREPELLKPNGMILGYPVITSGEYAHRDSIRNLLGDRYEELKDKMSLENQVNEFVPPTFMWHTFEDAAVPVQNSILLAGSLADHDIPVEFHLFQKGGHGLALANPVSQSNSGFGVEPSCECWIHLLYRWMEEWREKNENT